MHAYTELLDPGVVSYALFVVLGSPGETCLVLVRGGSLLQVYSDIYSPRGPKWLAEFPLDGAVTGLSSLSRSSVIIALKTAKLVVLDWDAEACAFTTRSLHYYEKLAETCKFSPNARDRQLLAVDAAKQCLVYQFHLDLAAFVTPRQFANPLFPELEQSSNREFKSSELSLQALIPNEEYAEIVDIAFLPIYTVPTLAILYWTEPNWEGLVAKFGERTKGLAVVSLFDGEQEKPVVSVGDIPLDVFKIVPVQVSGALALLIGSSSLSFVNEAGVLEHLLLDGDDAHLRLENCEAAQIPDTPWVVIALESGAMLAANMLSHRIEHLKPEGFAPEPTCVATTTVNNIKTLLIGSRLQDAILCRADISAASQPSIDASQFSFKSLYDSFMGQKTKPAVIHRLTTLFSFPNMGALTAVAPIDDGIACSSNNSLIIVERELPLIEFERVQAPVDLDPGRFWILKDATKNSKLLLVSSKTLDELEKEDMSASETEGVESHRSHSKRRRTKQSRESTVFYDDIVSFKKDANNSKVRRRPKQIRAFATDQATLAVHEGSEVVVVVQTRSLSAYETGTWKFLSATPIPDAYFAEIQDDLIVTQHREGNEARVYSSMSLELLRTVQGVDNASVCRSLLVTSSKSTVTICKPASSNESKLYNMSNLDRIVRAEHNPPKEELDLVAVFALEFAGSQYIGIHMNRLFCVYELFDDMLLKRFTVPFMVNQSPVWLASAQLLLFPGVQSYVLVKDRASGFTYHSIQTDGLGSMDFIPYSDTSRTTAEGDEDGAGAGAGAGAVKGNARQQFVWLDDRQRLHFSYIDRDVNYLSNKLPYRRILIDSEITIRDIAYHDDTQCVVIGANRAVKYAVPIESQKEKDDEVDEAEDAEMKDESDNQPEEIPPTESAPSAHSFAGCVFLLPLANYYPREVSDAKFEQYESVVSLECVDHCDAGGRQLVAIGTAKITNEDTQCNGHVYLYRIEDPLENDDEEGEEDALELPSLRFFAKDYLRGAVSCICEVMGFLAVAHGQQIHVYNFHKELEPVGFFDTEVYMKDMKSVRNLLLLGEEFRGPRLVNFGLQPHRMDLLSSSDMPNTKHLGPQLTVIEGVSSAYKGDLCLVSCDANGRLQILEYDPENPDSAGGLRLVPQTSFYTGRHCESISAVELANEDLVAYGVTSEGVLFLVSPISEEMFRTLFVLTQQMMDKEQSVGGMNPRGHRQMLATASNHEHRLIDFNYAQRLWSLALDRQVMYSRKLGFNGLNRAHRALNSGGRDSLKL